MCHLFLLHCPLPLRLNCIPSCTPAGISMVTVSSPYTRPSPLQVVHLLVIVVPSPLQVGQVVTVCICPKKVFCTFLTCPLPPQVPQVCTLFLSFAPLPLQVAHDTYFLNLYSFSGAFCHLLKIQFYFDSKIASANTTGTVTRRSSAVATPTKKNFRMDFHRRIYLQTG